MRQSFAAAVIVVLMVVGTGSFVAALSQVRTKLLKKKQAGESLDSPSQSLSR